MCVRVINAAWTTPLSLGRKWKGRQERGKELLGGEWDYQNGMILSEITPDGVEISFSAYNLVLVHPLHKVRYPSLIQLYFPSVYWDDSCRQFRKCRPNVSVELGSLNFFLFCLNFYNPY